jgi:hypothetical protein
VIPARALLNGPYHGRDKTSQMHQATAHEIMNQIKNRRSSGVWASTREFLRASSRLVKPFAAYAPSSGGENRKLAVMRRAKLISLSYIVARLMEWAANRGVSRRG